LASVPTIVATFLPHLAAGCGAGEIAPLPGRPTPTPKGPPASAPLLSIEKTRSMFSERWLTKKIRLRPS
jgi:hypothetical protein